MKTQLSMKEINRIPKNGYSTISLFAGCGGSSLGYKLAGYKVLLASEFIPKAIETYKANHPDTIVIEKDIRQTTPEEILELIHKNKFELDVLDGSPPCASFSSSGKKEALWGKVKAYSDTKQRVDDLFFEYNRIVAGIMPKVIVAENVKGLTIGKSKEFLDEVLKQLDEIGYDVDYKVLNSMNYDVPQKRLRTIIIGVRKDLNIKPTFPSGNNNIITVKDAIEDLQKDIFNIQEANEIVEAMKNYANTKLLRTLHGEGVDHEKRFNLRRNWWNKPSFTLLQTDGNLSAAGVCHPFEDRRHTIAEIKRLSTFPDDFILTGDYKRQYERIGRAVPPSMMKHIALHIKENILDRINK